MLLHSICGKYIVFSELCHFISLIIFGIWIYSKGRAVDVAYASVKRPSNTLRTHRMPRVKVGFTHLQSCTTNNRTILDCHNDYRNARVWKWPALNYCEMKLFLITVSDCYCKVTFCVYEMLVANYNSGIAINTRMAVPDPNSHNEHFCPII